MKRNQNMPKKIDRLLNLALVLPVMALALVAFFSLMEILLTLSAQVIVATSDSTVRSKYALVTVRNLWLIGGGAFLVGICIFLLDYGFKHWRTLRMRRLFLRVLAVELVIVGLQLAIAS